MFVYSFAACQCNGHSQCVNESICEKCEDLTTGRHCESCISGFYGDPTNGGSCQREYPWAVRHDAKSASRYFGTRLHLTCQYFTVHFYVSRFPDSSLHRKAFPGILKIYSFTANADSQSVGQQINCLFLRQVNLDYRYITATVYVVWFLLFMPPSGMYIYLLSSASVTVNQ